jgi:hypothetical protein
MDFEAYRKKYFVEPQPEEKFGFTGQIGITLYFKEYKRAVDFYQQALGPPAYVEGKSTKGWRVGSEWLTLLRGKRGNSENVEIQILMKTPDEAERLQAAFIEAGGTGQTPSDQLMYEPIRSCPVKDPFGTELLIFSRI